MSPLVQKELSEVAPLRTDPQIAKSAKWDASARVLSALRVKLVVAFSLLRTQAQY